MEEAWRKVGQHLGSMLDTHRVRESEEEKERKGSDGFQSALEMVIVEE